MRQTNFALAVLTAAVLTACGGSSDDGITTVAKPKFASQVTFGDSLSDVGTYAVGTVAALGGGQYTINGNSTSVNASLTGKNWTHLMAAQFGLAAPCAAQTGLDGVASNGFAIPVSNHLACTGYAQGGARVSNPVGPGHKLTGAPIGQLTLPLVSQVATHLARNGGKFSGNEVVFVMAGGNDALIQLAQLTAAATAHGEAAGAKAGADAFGKSLVGQLAAGATDPAAAAQAIGMAMAVESARVGSTQQTVVGAAIMAAASQPGNMAVGSPAVHGPMIVKATTDATAAGTAAGAAAGAAYAAENGPKLVPLMAAAGAELASLIRTEIVGKGANYVVLNNLPHLGGTPAAASQSASGRQLIDGMVSGFNIALRAGIDGLDAKVLHVDAFAASQDQIANPAKYGLTNVSTPACGMNPLGDTALVCNASNVIAGDVSHYLFADTVHPTPYGSSLIAKLVAEQMMARGWL